MKVALIVMHTLVATGLTLLIMMAFFGPHGNMGIGFVILFIGEIIELFAWKGQGVAKPTTKTLSPYKELTKEVVDTRKS